MYTPYMWTEVISVGAITDYSDNQHTPMLDDMVYKKRIQYDVDAIYCLSSEYIDALHEKKTHYMSALISYLECRDEVVIDKFMVRHGYVRNGQNYVRDVGNVIGFKV